MTKRLLVKVLAPVLVTTGRDKWNGNEDSTYMLSKTFAYTYEIMEVCRFEASSMESAKRKGYTSFNLTNRGSGEERMLVKDGQFRVKELS